METPVTWASLPHKGQLVVLIFARFCEPLVRTSIVSYIYYQLKSFDPALTPKEIVEQAAILQTVFTICQCFTALIWGRVADSPRGGRKLVLIIGLLGSSKAPGLHGGIQTDFVVLSCVAFGFVSNFTQAVIVRAIEGSVNGNVAVIRTMVSEIVQDQRYKQRAFLLMPMAFNVAVVIGPVLASMVVDSSDSQIKASLDAPLLSRYPFAKPALLNGAVLLVALAMVVLRLRETLKPLRNKHDHGLHIAYMLSKMFRTTKNEAQYSQVPFEDLYEDESEMLLEPLEPKDANAHVEPAILPLRRMFTRNLCLTIVCQGILEGHIGAYNTLWPSFLSLPAIGWRTNDGQNPFEFSGGLGMPVRDVALSMALLGLVGIPVQVFGYPRLSQRFGTMKLWRIFLFGFPLCYFMTPFTVILQSITSPSARGARATVWAIIVVVQALSVVSGTFVLPAQIMLTNNASPHPTALGRTHSAAVLLSSFSRSISPMLGGAVLGYSSERGMTELAWWLMCMVALGGCGLSFLVREGTGHEIWLPGDNDEESE
ncbi:hypothetical protein HBH64_189420 [Parastagonospora nodorum]|nr:hypothetical protein HBH53_189970 [Parastagonospora nodorum]KAH4010898.1 hypothetical protein HBI13_204220 [Parastagonospora nodorum]KAH4079562.1 hypothetical protein HBH46_232780 [Parastagonospora nodorum]KAH4080388.1 hypothetical protein HBH48_209960 [Parastagonospora nodorum]KAH4291669.1 hypothetical protein HBI01_190880 [Parastagonospora nodorum]